MYLHLQMERERMKLSRDTNTNDTDSLSWLVCERSLYLSIICILITRATKRGGQRMLLRKSNQDNLFSRERLYLFSLLLCVWSNKYGQNKNLSTTIIREKERKRSLNKQEKGLFYAADSTIIFLSFYYQQNCI